MGQLAAVTLLALVPTIQAAAWDFECERPRDSTYATTDGQNWTLTVSIPCSREETDGNGNIHVTDYELEDCSVVERQEEFGRDLPARMKCTAHDLGESSRTRGPDHVCVENGTLRMTCEYDWRSGGVSVPWMASSSTDPIPAAQVSESPGGGGGWAIVLWIGVVALGIWLFVKWLDASPGSPPPPSRPDYGQSIGYGGGSAVYPAPEDQRCDGRTSAGSRCEHYTGGGRFCWQHGFQRLYR